MVISKPSTSTAKTNPSSAGVKTSSSSKGNTSGNKVSGAKKASGGNIAIIFDDGDGDDNNGGYVYIPDPKQYYKIQEFLNKYTNTEDALIQISKYLFGNIAPTIKQVAQVDSNNDISILASVTSLGISKSDKEFIINNINKVNTTNYLGEVDYNKSKAVDYALKNTNNTFLDKLLCDPLSSILIGDTSLYYFYDYLTSSMDQKYYLYGQNCANFVSQALYEGGGLKQNDDWHYSVSNNVSPLIYDISKYTLNEIIKTCIPIYDGLLYNEIYHLSQPLLQKTGMKAYDVTESWSIAQEQYEYFQNISNGYTSMETIEIHNADEYYNALSTGIIEPGDLMYFGDIGKEDVHHATMITKINDKYIYYSGKSIERNNIKLDPNDSFDDQYVKIIHMNGRR